MLLTVETRLEIRYGSSHFQQLMVNRSHGSAVGLPFPLRAPNFSLNQVPRPDGKPDHLGLLVLDEPSTKQSDPTVLSLWLTENSKQHNITVSCWSRAGPSWKARDLDQRLH